MTASNGESSPAAAPRVETRPCSVCGTDVLDEVDPTYTLPWVCYWCHCTRMGFDHKDRMNLMAEGIRLTQLSTSLDADDESSTSAGPPRAGDASHCFCVRVWVHGAEAWY